MNETKNETVLIPLEHSGYMVHFIHRIPKPDEFKSRKQYCSTQDNTLWDPSIFSDQVADKFYKNGH
jgi:hypothetical protein